MKIKRKTFLGGIVATLCACTALTFGAVFSSNNRVNAQAATTAPASIVNLDNKGVAQNFFKNSLKGAQNENIYFGTNVSSLGGNKTGTITWRVLSTGADNTYSNGNMLLWADYQLGMSKYNIYGDNPEYAYWGTSYIRARMNGGTYYNAVSGTNYATVIPTATTSISSTSSWYNQLFTADEKNSIVQAGSYTTYNAGIDASTALTTYKKTGITTTSDGVKGKYNTNRINASSHPLSSSARFNSSNGTVWEETSGDKLFLLDYYDINNLAYGFGEDTDGDGVLDRNYANKVDSSWTTSSNWFPSQCDGSSVTHNNGITASWLSFSGDASGVLWLRNACRLNENLSNAFFIQSSGRVDSITVSYSEYGIRPALNFNPDTIVYATAASVGSNDSTFAAVDTAASTTGGKPTYKVYTKSSDYVNYNSNSAAAPKISISANSVTVTKSGQTGQAVFLLADKNAAGNVKYQATTTLSNGTAIATLPTGVKAGDYAITVLFMDSVTGGTASERVNASFTYSGIVSPEDYTKTYSGDCLWDENFENDAYSIESIMYTSNAKGATAVDKTSAGTDAIEDAGTYQVKFNLADGQVWTDGTTADKTITIKIEKANPNVTAALKDVSLRGQTLTLPPSGGILPELTNIHNDATAGEFKWVSGETPQAGNKAYKYTFTPKDENDPLIENNYAELTNQTFTISYRAAEIVGLDVAVTKDIYDRYTLGDDTSLVPSVKDCITVKPKYDVNGEDVLGDPLLKEDYTLSIKGGGTLVATEGEATITLVVKDKNKNVGEKAIKVLKAVIADGTLDVVPDNDNPLTYSEELTIDDIKNQLTVEGRWGYAAKLAELTADDYELTGTIEATADGAAGTPFTLTVKDGRYGSTETVNVKINKGTLTPTVTFADLTVTYDGTDKKIEATVSGLPDGVTLVPSYTVTGQTATEFTNAGTYEYTVSFTHDNDNYEQYTTAQPITATLKIDKASYTMPTGYDTKKQVTYTGEDIPLPADWITGLPAGVTVTYCEADGTTPFTDKKEVNNYTVKAVFTVEDEDNYNVPDPVTLTFEITNKQIYELSVTFEGDTVTYDGETHTIAIVGEVPDWITVKYYVEEEEFTGTAKAGTYEVVAKFTHNDPEYADIPAKKATLKIEKATITLPEDIFEDKTELDDKTEHSIEVKGLPENVTVTYEYDGKTQSEPFKFDKPGKYKVTAHFEPKDKDNYNAIDPVSATLEISDAVVIKIEAELETKDYTTANTLDDVKAKLTVTAIYDNGTKEVAKDYELTCSGLSDSGKFKFGPQKITVKYVDDGGNEFSTFVEIRVTKVKVALPTFKGGLKYTGVEVKPTVDNFNGYDSALMTFVTDKSVSGLNVGSYKAVFALNDIENYEWATTTTMKKALFAVALYDEEITLLANEAAVDWNIAKATLTATKTDGALPVFASDSYIGAFADVITLKYYRDEACTEEVAAEDLAHETQYYVKAELLDKENFELDASAAQYAVKSFTYTTPAKELTTLDKIVKFLKAYWLWIVIAVAALILLITIIALAARSSKRKRAREERRLAEEKEEKKREQEERREREEQRRREEREERMAARMAQPQMMPQMMGQMQMPQMPQSAQPAAAGGVASSSEIAELKAELKAEISALRSEQMAKELAELKAKQSAEEQIGYSKLETQVAAILAHMGGEQAVQGGISLDKLTQLIRTEVNNALDSREKPSATATADNAAAQVPPDAVMTTVTTTKIDTTKKSAQNAQNAQARPIVRSYVAPMPVDDGRVFDVGGFYTPADPLTDMNFDEEEKKD